MRQLVKVKALSAELAEPVKRRAHQEGLRQRAGDALALTAYWQALPRDEQRDARLVADLASALIAAGDSVAAQQAIETLATQLGELPPQLAESLRPSLEELSQFVAGDLLAAGKLAGDPQGLLLQAEREIGGTLEQLQQYASASGNSQAGTYQLPLFQAAIEGISDHNVFEGRNSSVGERSMLGVVQQVAKDIGNVEVGHLATFDSMFAGIRASLKSAAQRSIDVAERLVLAGAASDRAVAWCHPVTSATEARGVVTEASQLRGQAGRASAWGEPDLAAQLRHRADLLDGRLVDPLWRAFAARALQVAA